MRFVDFLRAAVLTNAAAATALATLATLGAAADGRSDLVLFAVGWWLLAGLIGAWLGRRREPSPAIASLLADARSTSSLPEQRPAVVLLNRLWPLLLAAAGAAVAGVPFPEVAVVAVGFTIIWALTWRRQDAAVTAIEERDGVVFYVEPTSPVGRIRLVRAPGFRRLAPGD